MGNTTTLPRITSTFTCNCTSSSNSCRRPSNTGVKKQTQTRDTIRTQEKRSTIVHFQLVMNNERQILVLTSNLVEVCSIKEGRDHNDYYNGKHLCAIFWIELALHSEVMTHCVINIYISYIIICQLLWPTNRRISFNETSICLYFSNSDRQILN